MYEMSFCHTYLRVVFHILQGTYEYGTQLLDASIALRNSCKLQDELSKLQLEKLKEIWRKLEIVTQEQMTRLRVSAVFHRSVNEVGRSLTYSEWET